MTVGDLMWPIISGLALGILYRIGYALHGEVGNEKPDQENAKEGD